jgi:hypothetical protein
MVCNEPIAPGDRNAKGVRVEMTTTRRITTTVAALLLLAAAGAQPASARPADFAPASHQSPASVYSRPDKALIPLATPVTVSSSSSIPPILPRTASSQIATTEQAQRQAAAYTPPKGSRYSDAGTNAYANTTSGHPSSGDAAVTTRNAGFDWGDAGIGAAGGAALAMLCLGGGLAISQRRPRRTRHTTALPS